MRRTLLSLIFTALLFAVALPMHAQFLDNTGKQNIYHMTDFFRENAGFAQADANSSQAFIGTIINAFLGLLGVAFLGLLIYGGYTWMTAQGNEEGVGTAKKIITQAVIGLAIVLAAYVISYFVVSTLQQKTLSSNAAGVGSFSPLPNRPPPSNQAPDSTGANI
ncbi:hypothetical protein HY625_01005 [Candidatus Uhrbacteria bacterium]|nr:hypothetical protein [Candidatus Uhrbacteria bacterium]